MSGWGPGIDGGTWFWCWTCQCSTPPTDRGTCATCGSLIVARETCAAGCQCLHCVTTRQFEALFPPKEIA